MRIVVINHVTLDGVMQGPGRADEDTRDGFTHGGWAEPNTDDVMGNAWGKRLSASGRLLLGRRTYRRGADPVAGPSASWRSATGGPR